MPSFRPILGMALIVSLLFGLIPSSVSAESKRITIFLDNRQLDLKTPPVVRNNYILVPIRTIVESLGATVLWRPNDKSVDIALNGKIAKLVIGQHTAFVDGQSVELDYPPIAVNGNTLLPLRFVSELFGVYVDWNSSNRTVKLIKTGFDYSTLSLTQIYRSSILPANEIYSSERRVIEDASSHQKKVLLKFDVSSLKGKKIKKAYLSLFNGESLEPTVTRKISVGQVLKNWNSNASWDSPDGQAKWELPGAGGASDELPGIASQSVFRVVRSEPSWFLDVSGPVKDWVTGAQPNNGLSLQFDSYFNLAGISNSLSEPTMAPSLVIELEGINTMNVVETYYAKIKTALDLTANKYVNRLWNEDNIGLLTAQYNLSKLNLSEQYGNNLTRFFDSYIDAQGNLQGEAIQRNTFYSGSYGNLLLQLYQDTHNARYLKAAQTIRQSFDRLPKVDGIYTENGVIQGELAFLGLDFLVRYGEVASDQASIDLAMSLAIKLYDKQMERNENGIPASLSFPDGSKNGTGWARGEGWLFAGLSKLLPFESVKKHPSYDQLVQLYATLAGTLVSYQDASGLWHNVIQDPGTPLETSGTALLALGFENGLHEGVLDNSYGPRINLAINGLQQYSKTGAEMSQSFPNNSNLIYSYSDLSSTRKSFGFWMQLLTTRELNRMSKG